MTMSRELFLAILAMDSYNRGYGQHIIMPLSNSLGMASIVSDSGILKGEDDQRLDEPIGFYAVAYDWNGEKIISYRGTNPDQFLTDAYNGYGIGTGLPYGNQAELAIRFYNKVVDTAQGNDPFLANAGVTVSLYQIH